MKIEHITARQIFDSRGTPTVEAEVWCAGGAHGRAAVPSGASTGAHEAHELRDGGEDFGGKGVAHAVTNINTKIKDVLVGLPADDQFKLDGLMCELDGTENKSHLGANAILAVSLAAARSAAAVRTLPLFRHLNDIAGNPKPSLPMPMLNVLNGGRHASHSADFQEYMVMPSGAGSYAEAMQIAAEVFAELKSLLHKRGLPTTVGDEGGFAPPVGSNTEPLDVLVAACSQAGHMPRSSVTFALDVAATEFLQKKTYHLATEARDLSPTQLIEYLIDLTTHYPITSIEDGLAEDAWSDWTKLTKALPGMQLVGDDLLVTNQTRLERAIAERAGNAILIKPNQIGTLTETIRAITTAKAAGWNTIISHRSGETEDVFIAHLAVGTGAGQIKTGSISRGERTAKHNELLRIESAHPDLLLTR